MASSDPASIPAAFSLTLFGDLDLRGRGVGCDRLVVNAKAIALLAYLAVPRMGRYVRRDMLTALLWPEFDQARARTSLRKTVHVIRRELSEDVISSRGDEEIALNGAVVWCDATAFNAAADAGFLLQAHELYRGELLSGFHIAGCAEFQRWLDDQRSESRERAAAVAWALAQRFEADAALSDAAGLARKSVRFSWTDERALRRALAMLDRLGDRAGALKLFDEFARRLAADLEAQPSQETLELVARLRGGPKP